MEEAKHIPYKDFIKFSDEESDIHVSFKNDNDILEIHVANKGVTIPKDELKEIFNPFIQSSKTKTPAGGTGLGLTICRRIIEDHGGEIWAESNSKGTTIKFYLPK